MVEEEEATGDRKKEVTVVRISSYCFGVLLLVLILSLRKLQGFLHLWFPQGKYCVHCLLCLIVVLVILSIKDPNVVLA